MARSANMAVSIRSRATTLAIVVILHALLILALLSAAAPTMPLPDERSLRVFDIVEPPPPPEIEPPAPSSVPEPAGGGGNHGPTPRPEPGNRAIVIAPPRPVEVVPLPALPILAPPATGASGPPSSGDGGGAGGGGVGTGRGTGTGAGTGSGGDVRFARAEWVRKPDPWARYEFWPKSPIGKALAGACVLACRVKPSGRPYDCIVVEETPVGMGIGKAGARLARAGRVKPVTRNGEAMDVRVVIPITFALHRKPKEGAKQPDAPSVVEGGI